MNVSFVRSSEVVSMHSPRRNALAAGLTILMAALLGGCANGKAVVIKDEPQFNQEAMTSSQPALVMFYKQGCASCAALEPTMDKLAAEYQGRAFVGKFMVMTFVFGVTAPDLKERYDVAFVPTVVLLVNGQQKGRWVMDYDADHYRQALDQYVAAAATEKAVGG